ncbi:phosphatase PAP2 family protein [Rhodoferax sp.]|uniref:phosphatase PAP2 family protein n=1 Tax=Rhodoferax sp. TaxID=50421 RepID=UPI002ACD8E02|nr:phosphatase PAP2 family protein [Rhodoferax sp.]MDZ7921855.1 phosphatase PAP2 family protein [Rhodoferax sp.]
MTSAPQVAPVWWLITHLGSSSLLLPAFGLLVWGLWRSGARAVARHYVLAMSAAVLLTVVSKCLFYGWGIGIAALDFTGISGHGLLASAVLPLLLRGLPGSRAYRWGPALGVGLALVVGVSRVMVGAHSVSEVLAAWLLGLAVSWPVVQRLQTVVVAHWATRFSPLLLVLALHTSTATYLPTHALEVRIALWLSGQVQPFTRHQLHQSPAALPKPARP